MTIDEQVLKEQWKELCTTLQNRFEDNMNRHADLSWESVLEKLESTELEKRWSLYQMEETGGEPDVVGYDKETNQFVFFDCSPESPDGRRSVCYDREGLESRKKHKPDNTAVDMANEMGIDLLTEEEYQKLQQLGEFDTKTSSWLNTPTEVRELGGAIFGDFRFGRVFVYHNGAQSYYGARGFRGVLKI
ncbi:DUF4256 domain-containing protein [Gracilimonas mengyeensis]|uniref:DUF4256 domain-containing protein n=1 Tax=Gracilimonas mengyeensis TaxID=1302730 RepID=A0A521FEZ7_9BACT|nr:DUF4256 domain-containing protein [Gracilimonas mengyeensis]SMO94699.1 Protein of unknown function [Gracilimonas mengyeensis]